MKMLTKNITSFLKKHIELIQNVLGSLSMKDNVHKPHARSHVVSYPRWQSSKSIIYETSLGSKRPLLKKKAK